MIVCPECPDWVDDGKAARGVNFLVVMSLVGAIWVSSGRRE